MNSPQTEGTTLTLRDLVETLYEGRRLLGCSVGAMLCVGLLILFFAEPVYRAEAVLRIEDKVRGLNPLEDASVGSSAETPSEAEIDLIRSRSVATEVIRELHLDIAVSPSERSIRDWISLTRERLHVDRLAIAPELYNSPLTLVAEEPGEYALLDANGTELLRGKVGAAAVGEKATILVTELRAKPRARFSVVKLPPAEAATRFLGQLTVTERGRNTGVIAVELRGTRPDKIQEALQTLVAVYLRRDVEHRAAAVVRRLEFVNSQLPLLKENLEHAELRLKRYRAKAGQLDVNLESKALIDRGMELDEQITSLKLQLDDLGQHFTPNHSSVVALERKLRQLADTRRKLDARAGAHTDAELASVRLERDVKVANELYVQLLAKAQELAVWKSANIGGVRLVDPAFVHPSPVSPDKPATLALSLLAGLALGLGLVLAREGLSRGIRSVESLERAFALPVYACLPRNKWLPSRHHPTPIVLAAPENPFVESLRNVRTRLLHELDGAPNKVVLLTSSRPRVGKSFVAVNLAYLLASTGKQVLLLDADLRRAPLRRYFPDAPPMGLPELLNGRGSLDALVFPGALPTLHFLASAALPGEASELLSGPAFAPALQAASARYDVVLCAAPPVLSVTDAAVVARTASNTLLIVKADEHSLGEVGLALSRLRQCGGRPSGFVINAVRPEATRGQERVRFHVGFDYR
jgi:tyrosine-protein kinase Etk/Wzc